MNGFATSRQRRIPDLAKTDESFNRNQTAISFNREPTASA